MLGFGHFQAAIKQHRYSTPAFGLAQAKIWLSCANENISDGIRHYKKDRSF